MNKNLLKSMFTTIMLVAMALTAQAQCYIIGNDGNWVTNKAGAELKETSEKGVYEGDVTFSEGNYYFFVATKLTEAEYDWEGLLPYRYNPGSPEEINVTYDTPSKIVNGPDAIDGSFRIADYGMHHITVNFNDMTVNVSGTYPEHIYLMGSDGNWATDKASATLERIPETGTYKANVTFTSQWFAFYTALSDKADDWDNINYNYRWAYNGNVTPNTLTAALKSTDATSCIDRLGDYEVTFNYTDKSFMLYDPTFTPVKRVMYFVGDANAWDTTTSFAQLEESDTEGLFRGNIDFPEGYFCLSNMLTTEKNDWEEFNKHRFGPLEDGDAIGEYTSLDLCFQNSTAYRVETAGVYEVEIDQTSHWLSFGKRLAESAISTVNNDKDGSDEYYDLAGRKLGKQKPDKGLYIKNGQKVIVR